MGGSRLLFGSVLPRLLHLGEIHPHVPSRVDLDLLVAAGDCTDDVGVLPVAEDE